MMMMMTMMMAIVIIIVIGARISVVFGRSQHLARTELFTEDMTIGAISH